MLDGSWDPCAGALDPLTGACGPCTGTWWSKWTAEEFSRKLEHRWWWMIGICLALADGEEQIGLGKNQSLSLHRSGHWGNGEDAPRQGKDGGRRSIVSAVFWGSGIDLKKPLDVKEFSQEERISEEKEVGCYKRSEEKERNQEVFLPPRA